jgi:Cation transporting ATPase, C-terminus
MQLFTAYVLKATDGVFFSRRAWLNKVTYLAFIGSLCIAFFVTHVPGVQTILVSNSFPLYTLPVAFAGGFLSLAAEKLRRVVVSKRKTRRQF